VSESSVDPTLVADEHRFLMGTYKRIPLELVRGQGCRVWDANGREYLDLVAGIAVNLLGHGHAAVTRVLAEQGARLIHTSNLYYTRPQVELARKLVGLSFPSRVFFTNSGAESNEVAIKVARKWGKLRRGGAYEIITALDSFHGRTMGAISATGQPKYQESFTPLMPGFVHVPYGDLEALKAATGPNTVAVMLEPIMGEIGVVTPPTGYLEGARRWCDEMNLLLILDEIQTGLGRTGRWFAHQHHDLVPDLMTLAKGLGGGLPIGACLAGERADVLTPGDHGSTFGGNPLASAVAGTVLATIEGEGLVGHAQEMGEHLQAALAGLPGVRQVRGRGLMQAVVLDRPIGRDFQSGCLEAGVIVNAVDDSTVRLVPPLIITAAEIDQAAAVMMSVLGQL